MPRPTTKNKPQPPERTDTEAKSPSQTPPTSREMKLEYS